MGPKQMKFMSSQFQQNNRVTLYVHTNQQIKAQKISRKDTKIIVTSPGDLPQAVFFVLCFSLLASFSAKPPSSPACSLPSKLPLKKKSPNGLIVHNSHKNAPQLISKTRVALSLLPQPTFMILQWSILGQHVVLQNLDMSQKWIAEQSSLVCYK